MVKDVYIEKYNMSRVMVEHTFSLRTLEAEAVDLWVQGQPGLQSLNSVFQDS